MPAEGSKLGSIRRVEPGAALHARAGHCGVLVEGVEAPASSSAFDLDTCLLGGQATSSGDLVCGRDPDVANDERAFEGRFHGL